MLVKKVLRRPVDLMEPNSVAEMSSSIPENLSHFSRLVVK